MIGGDFTQVLAAAQGGDEAAFARLWRNLNPTLLRYLSLGEDVAEDVAAETWTTVIAGLHRFRGDETAWRAWVFTTARRRAVDAGRKRARDAGLGWRASTWASDTSPDSAQTVLDLATTEDALRLVRRLPAIQAESVLLRVMVGLPVSEVAAVLGRSPGSVRVACHRGLKALAAELGTSTDETTRSAPAGVGGTGGTRVMGPTGGPDLLPSPTV